jgi:proline iminopeptidase
MTITPEPTLTPVEHELCLDGGPIRYRVTGAGPLLVVHPPGWGIGATPYAATLSPLQDQFTVVYLWPRGAAGLPPSNRSDLNVGAFAEDLEQVRLHLAVNDFTLAGHSHGGLIALHYALRNPGRVTRLLLLDAQLDGVAASPGEEPPAGPLPPEVRDALAYLNSAGGLGVISELRTDAETTEFLGHILPLYFSNPANMAPLVRAMQGLTLPRHTLQTVTATDGRYPLDPRALPTVTTPTVLVAGRQDRFCPLGQARQLVNILPLATLMSFEDSGHFPWLEEPGLFFASVPAALASAGHPAPAGPG